MRYAICPLSVIPVRREPSDASELVTEVLFGEFFKVLEQRASWSRVRLQADGREGWASNRQYAEIDEEAYHALCEDAPVFCAQSVGICKSDGRNLPVLIGSRFPFWKEGAFSLAGQPYTFEGHVTAGLKPKSDIARIAKGFLGAPYRWGGRSFFGIDGPGFTQLCYRLCGVPLPREAAAQAVKGETLSFVEEAEEGDLAFFDDENGEIVHVGIILEDNRIVHACGEVRIDRLDQTGIYNVRVNKYTHKLRLIKKINKR